MKNEKSPLYNKNVQKVLSKLIAEEMLANSMYRISIIACNPLESIKIADMFRETADDELMDHHQNLVKFAVMNDYDVPCQDKEYKKFASETAWKSYDNIKKDQDAKYYIDLAIKAEEDACESYLKAMDVEDIPYELYAIIQKNYYDEKEHLENLKTLQIANEVNAELVWNKDIETLPYWF